MIMVSFSIIATVVVLNFHHKPPLSTVMPKWAYRFFVKTLPKWLAIGSHPHLPHSTSASERLASAAKKNDLVISNFVHLRDTRSFCYGESVTPKVLAVVQVINMVASPFIESSHSSFYCASILHESLREGSSSNVK